MIHFREYRAIPELDVYDQDQLDEAEYDTMDPEARARAEKVIRRREKQEALASGRQRPGLFYGNSV